MELCSNCFKTIPEKYPFCPHCGSPTVEIGFKQCNKGHIIYETCRTCPVCGQLGNLGKSLINNDFAHPISSKPTEVISIKDERKSDYFPDKTVVESDSVSDTRVKKEHSVDRTAIKRANNLENTGSTYGKTRLETDPGKTVLEFEVDKTIMDADITSREQLPSFYAWLVFLNDENQPFRDIRLEHEKNTIGKGTDADIRLNDDFASRLHALVHYEDGHFFVSDLGSTNHTWLNENKVAREELKEGDIIRIGRQKMIFKQVRRNLK